MYSPLGCLEIPLCVLQDIDSLGPLPKKRVKEKVREKETVSDFLDTERQLRFGIVDAVFAFKVMNTISWGNWITLRDIGRISQMYATSWGNRITLRDAGRVTQVRCAALKTGQFLSIAF